jgi:hypothetical protein
MNISHHAADPFLPGGLSLSRPRWVCPRARVHALEEKEYSFPAENGTHVLSTAVTLFLTKVKIYCDISNKEATCGTLYKG